MVRSLTIASWAYRQIAQTSPESARDHGDQHGRSLTTADKLGDAQLRGVFGTRPESCATGKYDRSHNTVIAPHR
jgi:hypothetical protein